MQFDVQIKNIKYDKGKKYFNQTLSSYIDREGMMIDHTT